MASKKRSPRPPTPENTEWEWQQWAVRPVVQSAGSRQQLAAGRASRCCFDSELPAVGAARVSGCACSTRNATGGGHLSRDPSSRNPSQSAGSKKSQHVRRRAILFHGPNELAYGTACRGVGSRRVAAESYLAESSNRRSMLVANAFCQQSRLLAGTDRRCHFLDLNDVRWARRPMPNLRVGSLVGRFGWDR